MRGRAATVAVLMTDIEGSTAMIRELGDGYAALLEQHHDVVRAEAAAQSGDEITNAGDGLAFLFPTAAEAASAAVGIQRRLDGGPVRVRAAVHLGSVVTTGAGPVGVVLHECARLLGAASGRQILISPAARAVLRPPPPAVDLHGLGACRLRDTDEPWDVAEAVPAGQAPLGTLRTSPWSVLPSTPTSFVGRAPELERIARSWSSHRLITLTGPGGIGKTRLALESARAATADRRAGAALVELAAVAGEGVPAAVLRSIRAPALAPGDDFEAAVAHALAASDLLMVLDNCEHVLGAAALLVDAVRRSCPNVSLLATSREPLRVAGELVVAVPLLDEAATIRLVLDRVGDADPLVAADVAGSPRFVDLARRLEGVPLAVELAAARLGSATPTDLLEQLGRPLDVLAGGLRGDDPRHRSLRATLDWSWELLTADERHLLQSIALFTEWFEAADVATVADLDVREAFLLLGALRSKSLALVDTTGERSRFRLLQPVRQYALERLEAAAEAEQVRGAFVALQVRAAETSMRALSDGPHLVIAAFAARRNDTIAAIEAALAVGDTVAAMRLVAATGFPWMMTDPVEGYRIARRVMERGTGSEPALVRTGCVLGTGLTAHLGGDVPAARQLLDRAASEFQALGVAAGEAWALYFGAQNTMTSDGRERLARALRLFEGPPLNALGMGWTLTLTGWDHLYCEELVEAHAVLERAIALAAEYDVIHVLGAALTAQACLEAKEGHFERARALAVEGVEARRALGDTYQLISAVGAQSHVELMAGCDDAAAEHLSETLRLTAAINSHDAAMGLVLAAELLRRRGDERGAAHAHRLARRTWPHDEEWFGVLGRFVAGDDGPLQALPPSRAVVPATVRQRVEWAADRLDRGI